MRPLLLTGGLSAGGYIDDLVVEDTIDDEDELVTVTAGRNRRAGNAQIDVRRGRSAEPQTHFDRPD